MKIKNLKKKIIIKTDKNNIPIPGFHLTIIRDIEDPEKIKFIYTAPDNTKLLSQDDVKLFNDSLDIDLFPFKILYSNLTEDEKELLRESRQEKIEKKRKDDLNEYLSGLKIKQKYDKSLNHYKRKIMNMPSLTLEEKREKIKKHKLKCVNCQKNVGNIFVFQENGLHIKCGDQEAPCDFNKLYKKPSVLNMVVKIKELKERMNTIKEFIIRTKLEMIFKLDVNEELLKKFKKFNERYKKIKKEILFYEKKKRKKSEKKGEKRESGN